MRTPITVYQLDTGLVLYCERIDMGAQPIVTPAGASWIEGNVDGSLQLIIEGQPVDKPEMDIVVTGNTLTGIPEGAIIIANNDKDVEPIEDGDYTLDVDHPMTVHVSLQHPLYLTWLGEIACAPEED